MKLLASTVVLLLNLWLSVNCPAQVHQKYAAYLKVEDFLNQVPLDSFAFVLDVKNDKFVPDLYGVHPINTRLSLGYVNRNVLFLLAEKYMFLNLRIPGIGKGFVRILNPGSYNFFVARPSNKQEFNETLFVAGLTNGLLGVLAQEGSENNHRRSVPYIFSLENGKLYPGLPGTLDRILEPYPALFEAYRMEPSRDNNETIKLYIELLNELIATEPK